ncbi:MAG: right-handed parallel beta-helix repeat-containing protein [Rubripirellula sp.]
MMLIQTIRVFAAMVVCCLVGELLAGELLAGELAVAQRTRAIEQIPELSKLPDASDELQQRIDQGGGNLWLTQKHYRLTRSLEIELSQSGAIAINSQVGTTLIMDGPGPAIRIRGTHQGTASPKSFQPSTWNERMPLVSGVEILGAHAEADGIELDQTVGAIIDKVSVRWCRHGIRLHRRNRNVIVSQCHLYENSGVGVFLDDVNLHQINVANSHISYNRGGGIVVRDGNVRNLQVSGCDIEGNMPADETETTTANILIDVSGSPDDARKSIAEIAITGCTIQHSANYSGDEDRTVAPGGANIRLAGKAVYPIDSVTITGNVLSDTTTNVDIRHAHDVAIQANTFFAPKPSHLSVKDSQRVVVVGNTFNPRQFVRPGTIRFSNCSDCILSSFTVHRFATREGAIILDGCNGMVLTGLSLTDCDSGLVIRNSSDCSVTGCRVTRTTEGSHDVLIDESSRNIQLLGNVFSGTRSIAPQATTGSLKTD